VCARLTQKCVCTVALQGEGNKNADLNSDFLPLQREGNKNADPDSDFLPLQGEGQEGGINFAPIPSDNSKKP